MWAHKMTSSNGWLHQMETFSVLLAICAGNSPVTGEFPTQRPVTRSFHVFFDLHLNQQLSKQSWGWWFEMSSHPLWRHCNVLVQLLLIIEMVTRTPNSLKKNPFYSGLVEISFCCDPNSKKVVSTKFCIWQESSTVLSCAEIYNDLMVNHHDHWITVIWILHHIWIVIKKSLVKSTQHQLSKSIPS